MSYFDLAADAALGRLLTANFFHAAATGLAALWLYRGIRRPRNDAGNAFTAVMLIILAHGLYDALLSMGPWLGDVAPFSSIMVLIVLAQQFFRELRYLRPAKRDTISLSATLLFGVSVLLSMVMVLQAMVLPLNMAIVEAGYLATTQAFDRLSLPARDARQHGDGVGTSKLEIRMTNQCFNVRMSRCSTQRRALNIASFEPSRVVRVPSFVIRRRRQAQRRKFHLDHLEPHREVQSIARDVHVRDPTCLGEAQVKGAFAVAAFKHADACRGDHQHLIAHRHHAAKTFDAVGKRCDVVAVNIPRENRVAVADQCPSVGQRVVKPERRGTLFDHALRDDGFAIDVERRHDGRGLCGRRGLAVGMDCCGEQHTPPRTVRR